MMSIQNSRSDRIFNAVNCTIMILLLGIMIYPLFFVIIASLSDPYQVANGQAFIWPKGFTVESYQNVFRETRVWTGYRNTIVYTVFGTLLSLILTIPAGYVLSKKNLAGRRFWQVFYLIPMYFGGGLLPTYLAIKSYGLINQWYTLIVLDCLSIYNIIVTRAFFQTSIPDELYESARIDGASEFRVFFQLALPLAGAIVAVIALYYAVDRWNGYFSALIYTSKSTYQPLQIVLRGILLQNEMALANITTDTAMSEEQLQALAQQAYMAESMKYSLVVVASLPLLIAYPFVQKFFVKGVLIGSVKG